MPRAHMFALACATAALAEPPPALGVTEATWVPSASPSWVPSASPSVKHSLVERDHDLTCEPGPGVAAGGDGYVPCPAGPSPRIADECFELCGGTPWVDAVAAVELHPEWHPSYGGRRCYCFCYEYCDCLGPRDHHHVPGELYTAPEVQECTVPPTPASVHDIVLQSGSCMSENPFERDVTRGDNDLHCSIWDVLDCPAGVGDKELLRQCHESCVGRLGEDQVAGVEVNHFWGGRHLDDSGGGRRLHGGNDWCTCCCAKQCDCVGIDHDGWGGSFLAAAYPAESGPRPVCPTAAPTATPAAAPDGVCQDMEGWFVKPTGQQKSSHGCESIAGDEESCEEEGTNGLLAFDACCVCGGGLDLSRRVCEDSETWTFEKRGKTRDCSWVAKNTEKRCENDNARWECRESCGCPKCVGECCDSGEVLRFRGAEFRRGATRCEFVAEDLAKDPTAGCGVAQRYCPATCGTCPESTTDECNDSTSYQWKNRKRTDRGCDWVGKRPSARCEGDALTECPASCTCCNGDSTTWFQKKNPSRDCEWVSEDPVNRCKSQKIKTQCCATCDY